LKGTIYDKFLNFVIVICAEKKSDKLHSKLARKLGGNVIDLKDEQYEDIALESLMDKVRTNETVEKETVLKKLKLK
jgi:hypothetical protein